MSTKQLHVDTNTPPARMMKIPYASMPQQIVNKLYFYLFINNRSSHLQNPNPIIMRKRLLIIYIYIYKRKRLPLPSMVLVDTILILMKFFSYISLKNVKGKKDRTYIFFSYVFFFFWWINLHLMSSFS